MEKLEEQVKELINESLRKRLIGKGTIDTINSNETMIIHWLTAIMALGYNNYEIEAASKDINELQEQIYGHFSIEDTRAFVYLASARFQNEVSAFTKYVELRETEEKSVVLYEVKQELADVEEGEFYNL
jgi:hypothetical protein